MLKRYASANRIQWVGQAWEIKRALQQELKRTDGAMRMAELLAPVPSRKRHVRLIRGTMDRSGD